MGGLVEGFATFALETDVEEIENLVGQEDW